MTNAQVASMLKACQDPRKSEQESKSSTGSPVFSSSLPRRTRKVFPKNMERLRLDIPECNNDQAAEVPCSLEATFGRGFLLCSPTLTGSFSSTVSICSSLSHTIDKNYNFELPSHEVYMSDTESYVGQFTETRRKLDKTFHGFYRKDRQLVQDQIISYVLRSSGSMKRQRQPWIIFTAGAMGSGKSHTLNYLKRTNQFNSLDSYVLIDQDEIRSLLPEWGEYVKKSSRKAASLLQKESGYMCEIALCDSLDASRNIIFDSSLRDFKWWKLEFQRIRDEYPQYRIAILYIKTDLETAIQRTEARALKTGRAVPRQFVEESFNQSAESFRQLQSCAHLTAEIDTTQELPQFVQPSFQEFVDKWTALSDACFEDELAHCTTIH